MAETQQQGTWEDLLNFFRSGKTLKAEDLSSVSGVQSALDLAKANTFQEEDLPSSSDRTPETVKAIPAFKNPYGNVDPGTLGPGGIPLHPSLMGTVPGQYDQPDTAPRPSYQPKQQEIPGKYRFDPMLIEGRKPKSKHTISAEKPSFKAGSPTDLYLNNKMMTPEYLGLPKPEVTGGPADATSPEDPTPGLPEASSAPTKSSQSDMDKVIAEVRKYLGAPTDEKWDLSPAIAWSDSISGNNVLRGYKRPKSREDIIKERQELALKLGALAERRDYHDKMTKKGLKDFQAIQAWNEANKNSPEKQLNPFTGQPFQKNDPFDKILEWGAKQGYEKKKLEEQSAADKALRDEWIKNNPGQEKSAPYFKNGIPYATRIPKQTKTDKAPTPAMGELDRAAEADFIGLMGRPPLPKMDDEGGKDAQILGLFKKTHSEALTEAKRTGGNYYDIVEAKRAKLIEAMRAKSAENKAKAAKKPESKPGLWDKLKEGLNNLGL